MVRPRCSRRRNSSHVAHCGTRLELAMRTRGAHSWVRTTPTGLPDCTSRVSSSSRLRSSRVIASKASHDLTARPVPPYTTKLSGCSATSGSRLFISMRRAASCGQPLHDLCVPLGARTTRGPAVKIPPAASKRPRAVARLWQARTRLREDHGHRSDIVGLGLHVSHGVNSPRGDKGVSVAVSPSPQLDAGSLQSEHGALVP